MIEGFNPYGRNPAHSVEDEEGVDELEFYGEGFEKIPVMIDLRNEIFAKSENVWDLEDQIQKFLTELDYKTSPETLENCAAYYILRGEFESVIKATRFDLDEEQSMFKFLKTLQQHDK